MLDKYCCTDTASDRTKEEVVRWLNFMWGAALLRVVECVLSSGAAALEETGRVKLMKQSVAPQPLPSNMSMSWTVLTVTLNM